MDDISVKDLINYILSKIVILFAVIISVLLIGNIYSAFIKVPLYKSSATLVLKSSDNSITQTDVNLNNNLVSTYAEIVKSRTVLSKVKRDLSLGMTLEELSDEVSVTYKQNSQIMTLNVLDKSPDVAQKIASSLADSFIKQIEDIYNIKNVSIIDRASYNHLPDNRDILKENIVYFIIGGFLGVSLIILIYLFDTTIKNSSDIEEKFNLMVLGEVPEVINE